MHEQPVSASSSSPVADAQAPLVDMYQIVGSHDILFITLDTLRYDAAQACFEQGCLPTLAPYLPPGGWEKRHSPASFTYAAHQAFFAGFLPTPARPGPHPRLFALAFPGSETIDTNTWVFAENLAHADIVHGFASIGYHTLCIGGVGFFNRMNALGSALPGLFAESHWRPEFGVVAKNSTEAQVALACARLRAEELRGKRCFLFINVSALHQPNRHYLRDAEQDASGRDNLASHQAALSYVDGALAPLFETAKQRGPAFAIVCSDHGTAYGEDGYYGHRIGHEVVMTVPYSHFEV